MSARPYRDCLKTRARIKGFAPILSARTFKPLTTSAHHFPRKACACLRLLALDGITNPQNLGMILRSATAGFIDGVLLAKKGNAALGPLVIKASAGTAYRAPIIHCDDLADSLASLKKQGFSIATLEADATASLFATKPGARQIYVLGNETEGVSKAVKKLSDTPLHIPMQRGVESLNVAVTASLIAYAGYF